MDVHHIHIASSMRNSGTSSNFNITLKIPNIPFTKLACVKAAIPRTWYLIVAPLNTMQLVELGVSTTITVPPGNYNILQWAAQIPVLLTAASPNHWTYTAAYVIQKGTINWAVAGNGGQQPSFVITEMSQQMCMPPGTNTFVAGALVGTRPCAR